MRVEEPLNLGWTFCAGFEPRWIGGAIDGEPVGLPHTAVELPLTYFDETSYQRPFACQQVPPWEDRFEGKGVVRLFQGAMAGAVVWVNGREVARRRDGNTPFEANPTPYLTRGDNCVTVRVDRTENLEIPPFGGQIDYMTYAGLYREAHLRVTALLWIRKVRIETPEPLAGEMTVRAGVPSGLGPERRIEARLIDPGDREVARGSFIVGGPEVIIAFALIRPH